jgi:hypothetical protein
MTVPMVFMDALQGDRLSHGEEVYRVFRWMSHFQNSVSFESGFAVSRGSLEPSAKHARFQGFSFKMRLHFERASYGWGVEEIALGESWR